jgi:hypothetical protein
MLRRLWAADQAARTTAPPPGPRGARPAPSRGLLVLPYLSIVSEKAGDLAGLLAGLRWKVQGYQGERDKDGTPLAGKVRAPGARGRRAGRGGPSTAF